MSEQEWYAPLPFRVPIEVSAAGFERYDKPAEVELDLGQALTALGQAGTPAADSVRVVEVDAQGALRHVAVPFQLDLEEGARRGTLVVLLAGTTPAQATRHFQVYFDLAGHNREPARVPSQVMVQDAGVYEGQESLRITTVAATYFYHKEGAGFASLIDRDGNDWISYHPEGRSAGHFRGIPNLGECGHPGYTNSCSRVLSAGPLKARILAETRDGKWVFTWDFYPHYARMTLLRGLGPYYFLYEGTPGGKLDEAAGFCLRSTGQRTPLSEIWDEHIPHPAWACFGNGHLRRVLYLVRHETDPVPDQYWPMEHNMTVFGFGRKYKSRVRYMERVPAHFTIGLTDHVDLHDVRAAVDSAFRELEVTVGQPAARCKETP